MASEDTSLATTAASMSKSSTRTQEVNPDLDRVSHSLGKPSRKQHFKILDVLILIVSWICFAIAVIAITPRLNVAWTLRLQHQLELIGLMLSIMNLCLRNLATKLWIMAEASRRKPKLQNIDAILRSSIVTSNVHVAWRALLLTFIILPIALSLAYKEFIGGTSTHDLQNHTVSYGLTAAPGLTSNTILKFGPSYMTNATLPFITTPPDDTAQFPQTYGFNNLVISNTSTAFLDVPLPEDVLWLQQSLTKDITSSFTLTADVYATVTTFNDSIEKNQHNDAFWDFYLNQIGCNSTLDSFSSAIDKADLSSGKFMGILTGNDTIDASWMILSFFKSNYTSQNQNPATWIPAFRANAFLFNTRRETCRATWQITYNAMHLVEGDCSVTTLPPPKQDLLVTPTLVWREYTFHFSTYYMPTLVEYLAPLSSTIGELSDQVYDWDNAWLIPTFTTSIAAMYWSRITVFFGPDNYDNGDYDTHPPAWNDQVNYTTPNTTLLSHRQTMHPSWALFVVLAIQPILSSLLLVASFVLSHFSAVDGSNFGMIAILAGVRPHTLKLLEGASFSGTLEKPVSVKIHGTTAEIEEQPRIEYSFYDDRGFPRHSFTADLRDRFNTRKTTGYHHINKEV